jgi:hypothetical protein
VIAGGVSMKKPRWWAGLYFILIYDY